jgi:hypothetical protein
MKSAVMWHLVAKPLVAVATTQACFLHGGHVITLRYQG